MGGKTITLWRERSIADILRRGNLRPAATEFEFGDACSRGGVGPLKSTALLTRDSRDLATSNPQDENLDCAGVYRRTVRAGLSRVWENVFDWEHLPALHEQDFHSVDLEDCGSWGWRVRLLNQPGVTSRQQIIEMRADKKAGGYRVETLNGPGTGSVVRTMLKRRSSRRTDVNVDFLVPRGSRNLAAIGARYAELYARLWDQDEAMMMRRERVIAARRRSRNTHPRPKTLGTIADVRDRLPRLVSFGGERFRLVELDGKLIAHAVTCPHWLGPLDQTTIVDGCIRCPWHGYRFDIRTGASADGRNLSLPRAPDVVTEAGRVCLVPAHNETG